MIEFKKHDKNIKNTNVIKWHYCSLLLSSEMCVSQIREKLIKLVP